MQRGLSRQESLILTRTGCQQNQEAIRGHWIPCRPVEVRQAEDDEDIGDEGGSNGITSAKSTNIKQEAEKRARETPDTHVSVGEGGLESDELRREARAAAKAVVQRLTRISKGKAILNLLKHVGMAARVG